jgi:hypothetical protein
MKFYPLYISIARTAVKGTEKAFRNSTDFTKIVIEQAATVSRTREGARGVG